MSFFFFSSRRRHTRCSRDWSSDVCSSDGRADYTPVYLSEVEPLFESGAMPLDVALIQVSPPDPHGFCGFGVGVDTTLTAAKRSEEHTSELQSRLHLVCRLLLEKKKIHR